MRLFVHILPYPGGLYAPHCSFSHTREACMRHIVHILPYPRGLYAPQYATFSIPERPVCASLYHSPIPERPVCASLY